jgi:hypothetical protein
MRPRFATTAALTIALANPATAQPDMRITVEPTGRDTSNGPGWRVSAELLIDPPNPIIQIWEQVDFTLSGDGSHFQILSTNPSFDTSLSVPVTVNGPVARFTALTSPFLFGTPDSSNPLWMLDFAYAGDPAAIEMELIGENRAVFDNGTPFGDIRLYQDQFGNPGELSYEIVIIPAPATLALLTPAAALLARHRR